MALRPKVRVLRALSAHIAKKAIRLFVLIDGVLLILLFAGIWVLASFLNEWWWLLLVIYIPLIIASTIIYMTASLITITLYRERLSRFQHQQLDVFVNKIIALLETRGMGWWWFAALCVRDLVFYRELRTLNELLHTTTSLKQDFAKLEAIL
ncbi:MAG: hypothetical protein WBP22_05995 [Candidatus Saccharimonas sp.]